MSQLASTIDMRLLRAFLSATYKLDWWRESESILIEDVLEQLSEQFPAHGCLLQQLVDYSQQPNVALQLTRSTVQFLRECLRHGITLRADWPRSWSVTIDSWLGARFYLTNPTNFSATSRYSSIACSQIGRHGLKLPTWPSLLDAALQYCYRHDQRLLEIEGTTLSLPLEHFLARAQLQSLKVCIEQSASPELWLIEWFRRLNGKATQLDKTSQDLQTQVHISPPISQLVSAPSERPLQDRLAFAIADHVTVLSAREGGTIASLLLERLNNRSFPIASTFVATMTYSSHEAPVAASSIKKWLELGAVGWVIPESIRNTEPNLAHCQRIAPNSSEIGAHRVTQSLCFRMSSSGISMAQSPSPLFLVHCTRGNSGPLPDESLDSFLDRAWNAGRVPEAHPLVTLQQIIQQQRIVGNTHLTRSPQPCISFSAVPLNELIARRRFRAHLGRWDWEPFGLLIRRNALETLGAKPVIYGTNDAYKQLDPDEQPFFQPLGKKDRRTSLDWSSEQEWRLLGNLDLAELPHEAIVVFVATPQQAQQVAKRSPWTVTWLHENLRL